MQTAVGERVLGEEARMKDNAGRREGNEEAKLEGQSCHKSKWLWGIWVCACVGILTTNGF